MLEVNLVVKNGEPCSSVALIERPLRLFALVWSYPPRTKLDDLKALLGIKPGADFDAASRHEPGAWYPADLVIRTPEHTDAVRIDLSKIPTADRDHLDFDHFEVGAPLRVPDGSKVVLQFGEPLQLSVESIAISVFMGEPLCLRE